MNGSLLRCVIGHPRLFRSNVVRVLIIWGGIRIAGVLLGADLSGFRAALAIAGVVSALVMIDAFASREFVPLQNFGLPLVWLVALSFLTTVILEAGVHLAS